MFDHLANPAGKYKLDINEARTLSKISFLTGNIREHIIRTYPAISDHMDPGTLNRFRRSSPEFVGADYQFVASTPEFKASMAAATAYGVGKLYDDAVKAQIAKNAELLNAARAGKSIDELEALLAAGARLDSTHYFGSTLLHFVALGGNTDTLDRLVESEGKYQLSVPAANAEDSLLWEALRAPEAKQSAMFDHLANPAGKYKLDINEARTLSKISFLTGNIREHIIRTYPAISDHMDPGTLNRFRRSSPEFVGADYQFVASTPEFKASMAAATAYGVGKLYDDAVKAQIAKNAELRNAAQAGKSIDELEALLAAGARLDSTDKWGRTLLHYVVVGGNTDTLDRLVEPAGKYQLSVPAANAKGSLLLEALHAQEAKQFVMFDHLANPNGRYKLDIHEATVLVKVANINGKIREDIVRNYPTISHRMDDGTLRRFVFNSPAFVGRSYYQLMVFTTPEFKAAVAAAAAPAAASAPSAVPAQQPAPSSPNAASPAAGAWQQRVGPKEADKDATIANLQTRVQHLETQLEAARSAGYRPHSPAGSFAAAAAAPAAAAGRSS